MSDGEQNWLWKYLWKIRDVISDLLALQKWEPLHFHHCHWSLQKFFSYHLTHCMTPLPDIRSVKNKSKLGTLEINFFTFREPGVLEISYKYLHYSFLCRKAQECGILFSKESEEPLSSVRNLTKSHLYGKLMPMPLHTPSSCRILVRLLNSNPFLWAEHTTAELQLQPPGLSCCSHCTSRVNRKGFYQHRVKTHWAAKTLFLGWKGLIVLNHSALTRLIYSTQANYWAQ